MPDPNSKPGARANLQHFFATKQVYTNVNYYSGWIKSVMHIDEDLLTELQKNRTIEFKEDDLNGDWFIDVDEFGIATAKEEGLKEGRTSRAELKLKGVFCNMSLNKKYLKSTQNEIMF